MAPPVMTREIAQAAATDAGTRSMHAAGRTKWNQDDYNAAAGIFNRLWLMHSNEPMLPPPKPKSE
jgi:hypothetical protein